MRELAGLGLFTFRIDFKFKSGWFLQFRSYNRRKNSSELLECEQTCIETQCGALAVFKFMIFGVCRPGTASFSSTCSVPSSGALCSFALAARHVRKPRRASGTRTRENLNLSSEASKLLFMTCCEGSKYITGKRTLHSSYLLVSGLGEILGDIRGGAGLGQKTKNDRNYYELLKHIKNY